MFELSWELLIGAVAGGLMRYGLPGRNPGGLVAAVMVGLAALMILIPLSSAGDPNEPAPPVGMM